MKPTWNLPVDMTLTMGAQSTVTAMQCKHGTTIVGVGWCPPPCPKCMDEAWVEWFESFLDRYEAKHSFRYPVHGYDEADLREAFERKDANARS